jgi:3-polyprenyl-4-hydroxybenzoate decarboxylase
MGIDATRKWASEGYARGPWPGEIRMDEETRRRVDILWKQLGLD